MAKIEHITEGPIFSTILRLAWPLLASMFLEFMMSIANYFWVGFLGTPEQDAVTTSIIVTWTVYATISIIVIGITALVSRAIGAKDKEKAAYISKQGILMAIGVGAFFTVVGIIMAPHIMKFLKADPQVAALGASYLRVYFIGIGFFYINDALGAIFRASGNTRSPMFSYVTATLLNIVLDPFLIFGWGPFPRLGVAGAATATVISVFIGFIIFLWLILKGKLDFSLAGWYRNHPDFQMMLKMLKIGIPISIQNITFVCIYWFIIQMVHQFGSSAGAAMGIGNRLEALSYLVAFGFSVDTSTLVGQNLGAKQPERAAKCAWGSVGIIIIETFIVSITFVCFPDFITSIFTSDPKVHKIASDYVFILGLSQIFMGIEIVLEGAFSGAGDTLPPMTVSIPWSIARLPMAYYFCFVLDMGINGIWWTLTITSFFKAVILFFWFRRGNWKNKAL
ncbi:MAG: MATE family efflux transporter [candidate division Zixibacteria bacterium]|nr:MATE family efflux transporter [candidate division Zixibacteria bacterium]